VRALSNDSEITYTTTTIETPKLFPNGLFRLTIGVERDNRT
jgi:hypothetical protein